MEILDSKKVKSHLKSVYKYNFKKDLSAHVNLHRWQYAIGKEGGLLVCTWPKGGEQTLPMVYSNEVFTGIEYQAAAHMIMMGLRKEGLAIVASARKRHDGRIRNPFDEVECGSWYARAMSSYSLLQALTGLRYDTVGKTLFISPSEDKGDFQCFLSTAGGYGLAGFKNGKLFVKAVAGKLDIKKTVII